MSLAVVSRSNTHYGNSVINFYSNERSLSVSIDTPRLHIRSVEATEEEYDRYAALFGDPRVMEKFATGETKTREEIAERIQKIWSQRWQNKDPYTGLAVFKSDTNEFIGHIVLGHGDSPGEAELAYLFHHAHWGKGYGSEAARAVVTEYAPATVKEGYLLEGKPLERIVATCRADNAPSYYILKKKLGMMYGKSEIRYGNVRHHFSITLNQLQKKTSEKTHNCSCSIL